MRLLRWRYFRSCEWGRLSCTIHSFFFWRYIINWFSNQREETQFYPHQPPGILGLVKQLWNTTYASMNIRETCGRRTTWLCRSSVTTNRTTCKISVVSWSVFSSEILYSQMDMSSFSILSGVLDWLSIDWIIAKMSFIASWTYVTMQYSGLCHRILSFHAKLWSLY